MLIDTKPFSLYHAEGTVYFDLAEVSSFKVSSNHKEHELVIYLTTPTGERDRFWLYYASEHKLYKAVRHLKNAFRRARKNK